MITDWRGRFASSYAKKTKSTNATDGYDVVEWIAKQKWSNGKVGTYGGSALGDVQFKKPPILEMLQKWVQKIEAPTVPVKVSESSTLETVAYKPGVNGSEIIFTMVKGLGHYWPGGRYQLPESILGSRENLDAMDATKEIWDFFRSHPKNQPTINVQPYVLEVAPMIKASRTCVPVRFVSEALEASVFYDSKDQKITIQNQEITITLYVNKKEAFVEEILNGQKNTRTVYLEVPAFIMNGRTLVPYSVHPFQNS